MRFLLLLFTLATTGAAAARHRDQQKLRGALLWPATPDGTTATNNATTSVVEKWLASMPELSTAASAAATSAASKGVFGKVKTAATEASVEAGIRGPEGHWQGLTNYTDIHEEMMKCEQETGTNYGFFGECPNGVGSIVGIERAREYVELENFKERFGVFTEEEIQCVLEPVDNPLGLDRIDELNDSRFKLDSCFHDILADDLEVDQEEQNQLSSGQVKCKTDLNPDGCTGYEDELLPNVPCCYKNNPCKEFDPMYLDGRLRNLMLVCGANAARIMNEMSIDDGWVKNAECGKISKMVTFDGFQTGTDTCTVPDDQGRSIAIPVTKATWWLNVVLAYVVYGDEGIARLPSCYLPFQDPY